MKPEAESVWSGPRNDAPVGLQFRNPENRTEQLERVQVFLGLLCYFFVVLSVVRRCSDFQQRCVVSA